MEHLSTFLLAALFVALGTAAYTGLTGGAPTVPTRRRERRKALELAELSNGQKTFCDLGSGTGKLLFEAAEKYPNCRAVGVEVFVLPYLYSRIKKIVGGKKYQNVELHFRDMYRHDIADADVVFTFQIPGCYEKLRRKFAAELGDDALLIIEAWEFPDIPPLEKAKEEKSLPLYLYRGKQFRQ